METKNKPVKKFKSGSVSSAFWLNERQGKNGKYIQASASLQKSYTDANGEWKNHSVPLNINELTEAIYTLGRVLQYYRDEQEKAVTPTPSINGGKSNE